MPINAVKSLINIRIYRRGSFWVHDKAGLSESFLQREMNDLPGSRELARVRKECGAQHVRHGCKQSGYINHVLILPKRATDERSEDFLKFLR